MYVGVDIGGTKVLAVELFGDGDDLAVAASVRVPVPAPPAPDAEVEQAIVRAVTELAAERGLSGVGVSAAGLVDAAAGRVRFSAHLPWRDAPVRDRLADRLGAPVVIDNDANCTAYAELVAGALRGSSAALLVAVGTGIGGAVVLDARVVRGANGLAGEFGHMQVVPGGRQCECGLRGCWEQYCSGPALERAARSATGSPLDGREVARLARDGHPGALEAFTTVGAWLGSGTAGLVSAFDPERVVVGGGMSDAADLLLEPARRQLRRSLQASDHRSVPELVPARFGPEAGAVGAALLAAGIKQA